MQIHQMSVSYLPEQDRILMRINTMEGEETRLWLTRRLMVGLWPLLSKLLTEHQHKLESAGASLTGATPELKKMLADFRKEEFLQHADFDTPYKDGQQRLLAQGQALLQSGWREPFVPVVATEPASDDDAARPRHLH